MQPLLKILTALIELIELVIGSVKRKQAEQARADIRRDPVAGFDHEFGELPADADKAAVPGDKASAALNPKE